MVTKHFALTALLCLSQALSKVLAESPDILGGAKVAGEYIAETGFYQSLTLTDEDPIVQKRSQYQDISVLRSKHYGKILMLDGVIQLTERDADAYNEMMVHPAMFTHKMPKRVLIIGGGDGYVLSEVLKHSEVEHVDHVDLDGDVIDVCRDHFSWGEAWNDPRVHLHIADGAKFAESVADGFYQVIIQDSSDPYTWDKNGNKIDLPSKSLYSHQHFENIERILSPDGLFNFQAETFNIEADLEGIVEWRQQALALGFEEAKYGSIMISSYPTGQIGFLLCKKSAESSSTMKEIEDRFSTMVKSKLETTYYQPKLQRSAFNLPLWVERRIYSNIIISKVAEVE
jgi:spermidine synthase